MLKKSSPQNQLNLFCSPSMNNLNLKHRLILLANAIDWNFFEKESSVHYSNVDKPSMPIRFLVGCLLLKRLYNLGDEKLAEEWIMNPYAIFHR